jgi:hypothetical protein
MSLFGDHAVVLDPEFAVQVRREQGGGIIADADTHFPVYYAVFQPSMKLLAGRGRAVMAD